MVRYSIIIPTLNEEKFLPNLLASCAAQTQKNFEVIVVDGSSKDNTVSVAKSFAEKLPKLTVLAGTRQNAPYQRNTGANVAKGTWLLFIDADSVLFPYSLTRIEEFLKNNKPQLFTTWCKSDSDQHNDAVIALVYNMILELFTIWDRPMTFGPFMAVRRDVFKKLGGFDETHTFNEDVDLGMRAHRKHMRLHIIPETLFVWSLRRLRNENKLKLVQQYIMSGFPILLFKRPFHFMPGYATGGHLYGRKSPSVLKRYERKFRVLLREFFE